MTPTVIGNSLISFHLQAVDTIITRWLKFHLEGKLGSEHIPSSSRDGKVGHISSVNTSIQPLLGWLISDLTQKQPPSPGES